MENLYQTAKDCFLIADPDVKIARTNEIASMWFSGKMEWLEGDAPQNLQEPGRLDKPEIVMPRDLKKRKPHTETGRAALIHSLAHIELTAVNLAWDAIYRYRDMPKEYYADWVQCAKEEAGHFALLRQKLRDMGFDYGSFAVHGELWKMAITTKDDLTDRMAIVHRVFEARALDVIPHTLGRFEQLNDTEMVKILNLICNDEIGHVNSATRWFRYRCEQQGMNPDTTFVALLKHYLTSPLAGPFNYQARKQSGFNQFELDYLDSQCPNIKRQAEISKNTDNNFM